MQQIDFSELFVSFEKNNGQNEILNLILSFSHEDKFISNARLLLLFIFSFQNPQQVANIMYFLDD